MATPDQLDTLLEALHGHDGPPAGFHEGEHLFATERVVVSPGAGVFRPDPSLDAGLDLSPGQLIGHVGDHEVRSPFAGSVVGVLAVDGERVTPSQPIAWLRSASMTGAHASPGGARPSPTRPSPTPTSRSPLDTTDEWILERTGIHERRIGGTTSGLAIEAGDAALDRGRASTGADIDLVVVATIDARPAPCRRRATVVQDASSASPAARSTSTPPARASSTGSSTAHGLVATGHRAACCSIGAETMSRIIDWEDRNTAILFGDGAGAVVVEAVDGPGSTARLGSRLRRHRPAPALRRPSAATSRWRARRCSAGRCGRWSTPTHALARAGRRRRAADIDLAVPHQANVRIIDAACQRLGIPVERTANVLDRTGNTSAASIPLALVDAIDAGRVHDGDLVLLVGFGAGMSWASAVIRWDSRTRPHGPATRRRGRP